MKRKKLTIKDIAKLTNVSIATVSNVINGTGRVSSETIQKVQRVIDDNQFKPSMSARSLKQKESHLIAVIVPLPEKGRLQDNPFYWQLVSGIESGAREHQLHVLLMGINENESFSFVDERHLDGLIVVGMYEDHPALQRILELSVPIVFVDSYVDLQNSNFYHVYIDDEQGGYLGTSYLLSLGHQRIALLSGEIKEGGVGYQRWLGYCRALQEYNVPYCQELVIETPVSMIGGRQIAEKVAQSGCTAVFALSDIVAFGLLSGLHDLGVDVPRSLSVVGFDNQPSAEFTIPTLTSIDQDIVLKGRLAVEQLFSQIHPTTELLEKQICLPVTMKERKSVRSLLS